MVSLFLVLPRGHPHERLSWFPRCITSVRGWCKEIAIIVTRGWLVLVFTSRCVAIHFLPFFSSSFSENQCYSFVRVIVFQKGKKARRTVFIGWRTRWTRWPASFFFFFDTKSRKKPRDETTSPFLTPSILYLCWLRCRVLSPVLLSSSSFTFTWFFLVVCYWNCCAKLFLSFFVFLLSSNRRKLLVNRCHF